MDEGLVEEIGNAIVDTLKRHSLYGEVVAGDLLRSVLNVIEPARAGIDVAAILRRSRLKTA